jgi:putative transposase
MIDQAVNEIASLIGTHAACRALGASRASLYRRRGVRRVREHRPRPTPVRALSEPERVRVLELLNSPRFVDASPAQVYATLLDEGTYLASERTMYRVLAADTAGFVSGVIS